MLKSTFSILILVFGFVALAQKNNQEVKATMPEEEKDFRPSMLRLSYDFIPLGESIVSSNRGGHHFQASIDFYKYYLIGEYGIQQSERGGKFGYDYSNEGSYFRIGPEVNLLKNSELNSMTFGIRYARSTFDDRLSFTKTDEVFGNGDDEIFINESNSGVVTQWAELTAGLNVNVWKGLYMGYTIRYKFFKRMKGEDILVPYDIPGFGLNENRLGVGFNYFIGWAFRLREKEQIEEPVED